MLHIHIHPALQDHHVKLNHADKSFLDKKKTSLSKISLNYMEFIGTIGTNPQLREKLG